MEAEKKVFFFSLVLEKTREKKIFCAFQILKMD